jgi:hypothetical protein
VDLPANNEKDPISICFAPPGGEVLDLSDIVNSKHSKDEILNPSSDDENQLKFDFLGKNKNGEIEDGSMMNIQLRDDALSPDIK